MPCLASTGARCGLADLTMRTVAASWCTSWAAWRFCWRRPDIPGWIGATFANADALRTGAATLLPLRPSHATACGAWRPGAGWLRAPRGV